MEPRDLPHLELFDRYDSPRRVVEVADVTFIRGRRCTLHVLGIQKDRRGGEWNLVHALNYLPDGTVSDRAALQNAMLEDVEKYSVLRRIG